MAGTYGFASKVKYNSQILPFESFALANTEEFFNARGMAGSASEQNLNTAAGVQRIAGTLVVMPNGPELSALLAPILGTAGAITDAIVTATLEAQIGAQLHTFANTGVNTATFEASAGAPLRVSLDLLAQSEVVTTSTVSGSATAGAPFMFSSASISFGGSARSVRDFSIAVNNNLDPNRHFNSTTMASVQRMDMRAVMVNMSLPYGDYAALYSSGVTGVALVATFTNGTSTAVFSASKVQYPRLTPSIGREEIMLPIQGQARADGGTAELTITVS